MRLARRKNGPEIVPGAPDVGHRTMETSVNYSPMLPRNKWRILWHSEHINSGEKGKRQHHDSDRDSGNGVGISGGGKNDDDDDNIDHDDANDGDNNDDKQRRLWR